MVTPIIDLSGDPSDDDYENEEANPNSSQTQAPPSKKRKIGNPARSPFQRLENGATFTTTKNTPKADEGISPKLAQAIDAAGLWELRDILKKVCRESLLAERVVEKRLLSGTKKELRQLDDDESSLDEATKRLRELQELLEADKLEADELEADKLDANPLGNSGGHQQPLSGGDKNSAMRANGESENVIVALQSVNPMRDRRREALLSLKRLLDGTQRGEAFYLYLSNREEIKGKNVFIALGAFVRRVTLAILIARLNKEIVRYTKKRAYSMQGQHGDFLGLRSTDCDKAWANYKKEVAAGLVDTWVKPVYTHAELRALGLGWGTCGILEPGIYFRQAEPTFDDEVHPLPPLPP